MTAADVLQAVALLAAVVALSSATDLVGDVGTDRVELLGKPADHLDEQLRGGLGIGHGPVGTRVVPSEDEADEVAQLPAARVGVELVGELERVVDGLRLPLDVVRHMPEHERQVEADVVGHDRRVADPFRELRKNIGGCRRGRDVGIGQAMDLVPDDGTARIDQRLEAIDHLSIANPQRGQVDDIAVLRLHRGGLEVKDDELAVAMRQRLAQLDDRIGLGADEGHLLGAPGGRDQLVLELDALLQLGLPVDDGVGHHRLRQDLRPCLNHHHRVAGPRHDQVQLALVELAVRGIRHELAVDATDTHRADRPRERDRADRQRRRSAVDGQDVRVVLLVRGEDREDHLDVIAEALGEERTQRTVREAHGQDGRLGRARLALDESARDLASGVHPLFVVDGEREEVDALARFLARDRGREDH